MSPPASRMDSASRRRHIVEHATALFGELGYTELSMSRLATAAGISKPLLYHYFPSKRALFAAALQHAAAELGAATEPLPDRPPSEQLAISLGAFLAWVDRNRPVYAALLRSQADPEVRELVGEVRAGVVQRILDGLGPDGGPDRPAARVAVEAWLASVDGACLAWIEGALPLSVHEVQGILLGSLGGALMGAGIGGEPHDDEYI